MGRAMLERLEPQHFDLLVIVTWLAGLVLAARRFRRDIGQVPPESKASGPPTGSSER